MIKVKEEVKMNGITFKGNMPDILTYLEREQQRCPKMTVPQYIRLRKLEREESKQFGVKDTRRGYENVLQ